VADNNVPKIMIVDDASFTRLALRRALEKHQLKIIEAGNAEEAFTLFLREQPALVITDLMLPGNSGIQLFEQSLQSSITPFFLITHVSDGKQLDAARAIGFAEVLQKPIDAEQIYKLIQRHLPGMEDPTQRLAEVSIRLEQRVLDAAAKAAGTARMKVDEFLTKLVTQALTFDEPAPEPAPEAAPAAEAAAK
jgi:DNA-binding NtrC family response regulator